MNYIAYTIGPIYETIFDTLNGKNKTKKLKAGSYFFSLFMKILLKEIENDFSFLVPYIGGDALIKEHNNMGLFHDRFIAQTQMPKEQIKKVFDHKVDITFKKIAKIIEDASIVDTLKKNMDNHSIIASEDELKNINENIIFALNQILDSMELQREFIYDIERNYIKTYQEKMVLKLDKVKNLETLSGNMNYYAVITADGDKMGAKIKEEATKNPKNIQELSKKLYDFFTTEDNIYTMTNKEFGGELIYAGGDDILAFLPLKYGEKTFLDYIESLSQRFTRIVGDDVSLSFGVNIVYYKYPLRDALQSAFNLLHKAKTNAPNSVSLKITKHSGQYFHSVLNMRTQHYDKYKNLLDAVIQNNIKLPHSIHHSLKVYEKAIIALFSNPSSSLDAMFATLFNDVRNDDEKRGLQNLKEYIAVMQPTSKKLFDDLFSQLSIIKFLREDRK